MLPLLHKKTYHYLNKILVDEKGLINNYRYLAQLNDHALIAPVLKSNAYGHGINLVAPIFDQLQPPFLVVDSLYEAYELYKQHIKTPILIIGYTDPRNYQIKPLPFHYSVFDLETARALNKYQPGAKVHVFVDTGMSREGVLIKDLFEFINQLQQLKKLEITGLASHLADADNLKNQAFTQKQIKNYQQALQILNQAEIQPQWRHLASSAGVSKVTDKTFNLIRAGLATYGVSPFTKPLRRLQPSLTFQSTLIQIKEIQKGDLVSYNCTFKAPQKMLIGILPAGYYEGVERRLSNQGIVKVKQAQCPIIGRVCMNLTIIDLSQVKNPQVGDRVEVYGVDPEAKNSIAHQAQVAKTIPYTILTGLADSVRRELR